ncbi:3-deoxy-7-phosphoheptulonate synthase [Candidatus Peregrinibacteria bacterium]|nr:3-deoxy-7-phosphoheptulonate synthase [Candidatus Peregrinibacteria bacterium]
MIIVMKKTATDDEIKTIIAEIKDNDLKPMPLYGTERTVIAVIGDERILDKQHIKSMPGVSDAMLVLPPYKLVSRETKFEDTIVTVKDGIKIGGKEIQIMAGPCAVENYEFVSQAAKACKKSGAKILRGGAFKPRTGPYSFQGLGEEGLKILQQVGKEENMATVTEVLNPKDIELVAQYTDILQVGARNMQNFNLLEELGKVDKPVLLKRGMSAKIKEWLLAAEYIMSNGNPNVIMCERGIRTFEQEIRSTLALTSVPIIKKLSHLPIIVDPSHSAGKPYLIPPMAKAAIACGADGIIVEVHPKPEEALCDGQQALLPDIFDTMMQEIKPIAKVLGRVL